MNRIPRFGWLALALLGLSASSSIAEGSLLLSREHITDIAVGIFCKDGVGIKQSYDPNTIKGTVERMDRVPTLVRETQVIPAIDKILFGILAREKVENGTVLITVTHPPLGAQGLTVESWETQMDPGKHTVHAYYLGLSDGSPLGRWTITGASNAGPVFYAEFDVVPVAPGEQDPCIR
jgi:Domain of unknown function (DUF3859)